MAVMEAQQWCEKMENKQEMARDRRPAPVVQRAGAGHRRPPQGRHQLRQRPGRQGHQPIHEVLERAAPPIRSRATTPGSSRENIRWGKFEPRYRHQGAGRQGQPRGPLARGGQGRSAWPRRHPGRRRRAARRPSSTARCSIRTTPAPTSTASRSRRRRLIAVRGHRSGDRLPSVERGEFWREHAALAQGRAVGRARAPKRSRVGCRYATRP